MSMSGDIINLGDRRKNHGRRAKDRQQSDILAAMDEIHRLIKRHQIIGIAFVAFTAGGYQYGVYGTAAKAPAQTAGHLLRLSNKINSDLL